MAIALEQLPIKWSVFTPYEQELLRTAYNLGHTNAFAASFPIRKPEQEKEIQKLMNAKTPLNIGFVSEVKKEMDILESKGEKLFRTPEDEAMWQKRLDDEYTAWTETQKKNLAKYEEDIVQKQQVESSSVNNAENTINTPINTDKVKDVDALSSLNGQLPEKSIEKLKFAGITGQAQLFAMTYPQAIKLLGPLVATRFRDRFAK